MERIAWSQIRSLCEPEIGLELRICLEVLWVLPVPPTAPSLAPVPSNVLIGPDGTVQLDSAPCADGDREARYLAPELLRGETATLASAIYSLGAVLFEAVSGDSFESSELAERELRRRRAAAYKTGTVRDFAQVRLLEVAVRATRVSPERRWATPEIFSRELGRVASSRIATREELAGRVLQLATSAPLAAQSRPTAFVGSMGCAQPSTPVPGASGAARVRTLRGIPIDLSSYPSTPPASSDNPPNAEVMERSRERGTQRREPEVSTRLRGEAGEPVSLTERPVATSLRPLVPFPRGWGSNRTGLAAVATALAVSLSLLFMVLGGWEPLAPLDESATLQPPSERQVDPKGVAAVNSEDIAVRVGERSNGSGGPPLEEQADAALAQPVKGGTELPKCRESTEGASAKPSPHASQGSAAPADRWAGAPAARQRRHRKVEPAVRDYGI